MHGSYTLTIDADGAPATIPGLMSLHRDGTITAAEAEMPSTPAIGAWEQQGTDVRGIFYFLQFDAQTHQHSGNGRVTFDGEIDASGHGELRFAIDVFPATVDLKDPGEPVASNTGIMVLRRITP